MSTTLEGTTEFLNVDLDIYSRRSLKPLVRAFGEQVIVLYLGRERQDYVAHLELADQPKAADRAVRDFGNLVNRLTSAQRKIWNTAIARSFNIGIQAASKAKPFEIELSPRTIRVLCSLNAGVAFTVYAPRFPDSARKRNSRSESPLAKIV